MPNKTASLADLRCFRLNFLQFLFLVILELKPDLKVDGLSRGAAVWRLLCRVLEEPFDVLGLVASRFRGKSKIGVF